MATANVKISQILLKRGNTTAASNYTGPLGEVIIDTGLQTLRIQDGTTPGGHIVQGSGGSSNVTGISSAHVTNGNLLVTLSNSAVINAGYVVGPQGIQGNVGATGPQGIQGNTGPQGIQGNVGPQGIQGIQGNVGPQGIQGIQGNVGPQGIQGNVGPQGIQGIQGIRGNVGPQGIQGNVGSTGATGAQGIQGNVGATGATGAQGIQGIQGNVGPQGIQGNVGPKGDTGAQGIQGIQGNTGATGSQGIQGNTGATGSQGIQGVKGDRGDQGISVTLRGNVDIPSHLPGSGNPGDGYIVTSTGNLFFWNTSISNWADIGPIVGPRGDKGDTGAQGIQGNVGPQGIQGIQGNVGPQGIQGIQGIQGNVGATGAQGIQGNVGPQGPQGIQGIQGNVGPKGDTGAQGIQGIQGNVGPQGEPGSVAGTGDVRFNNNYIYTSAGQNLVINPGDDDRNKIVIPGPGNGADFPLSLANAEGNVVINAQDSTWNFVANGALVLPGSGATISNAGEFRLWSTDTDITVYRNGRDGYAVKNGVIENYVNNGRKTVIDSTGLTIQSGALKGNLVNFGHNSSTLHAPAAGGGNDRIRLWDFENGNPSHYNYAIGAEADHVWFGTDHTTDVGGFKFYGQGNLAAKIGAAGTITLGAGSTGIFWNNGAAYSSGSSSTTINNTIGANIGTVAPSTGVGTVWYDMTDGRMYANIGNVWVDANPTVAPLASYYTGNLTITDRTIYSDDAEYTFGTDGMFTTKWGSIGAFGGPALMMVANVDLNQQMVGMFIGNATSPTQGSINVTQESAYINVTNLGTDDGYSWQFDNTGNLTLPTSGKINYANGRSILSGITAGVNTGDITFSHSDIIGIGTNVIITADTTDWTFYSNANLVLPVNGTIKNHDGSTYGGANTGNILFSDTTMYTTANLTVGGHGNVYVSSLDGDYVWNFDADGTLHVPGTGTAAIEGANGSDVRIRARGEDAAAKLEYYNGTTTTSIVESSVDKVSIYSGGKTWEFGADGNLTLPTTANINYANGRSILSGLSGSSSANTGNISFANTTMFSGTGITVDANRITGIPTSIDDWQGGGGWNQGFYDNLATTGGTGTGLTVDVAAGSGGYINISVISIHTPGSGYTVGDVITINNENNIPGTITITGVTDTSVSWTFGTDGILSLPANGTIKPYGASNSTQVLKVVPTGGEIGDHIHLLSGDISTTSIFLGSDQVYVRTRADGAMVIGTDDNEPDTAGQGNRWIFDGDGGTTFPDHKPVTITGNLTVGNLIVNGNTTTINTESYTVVDNIIQMAAGNPADTLDIGFVGHRTVNGQLEHTGLVRDASTGIWELFSNVVPQPGTTVDFVNARLDDLQLDKLYADTIHLSGTPPSTVYGATGDLAGDIHIDSNYLYYCTANWVDTSGPWYTTLTADKNPSDPFKIQIAKSSVYGTPVGDSFNNQGTAWLVSFAGGPSTYVDMAAIDAGTDWILDLNSTPSVFGIGTGVTFTNPVGTQAAIWKTIPLTSFGNVAYTNANVASYLVANPQAGTYSNTNVSAYLTSQSITSANIGAYQTYANTAIASLATNANANTAAYLTAGISGNVKTSANVIAPNFLFANGVNILSTVSGSYGNMQVAQYLPTYSGNIGAANIVTTGATSGNISGANYISANVFQVSTGIFWANGVAWSSSGGSNFSNSSVATFLGAYGSNVIVTTGNITAGNINGNQFGNSVGTTATYTGNITAANIITTGTYGNITGANVISANTVTVTTVIRTVPVTFANLPAASAVGAGARAFITDGNTSTFASAVTGSGANSVPVYSNGTNWFVG